MSDHYEEAIHVLKGADSGSDIISEGDTFLTKGAFLLTPSHGLSIEKASSILDKIQFKGCFSLTKTATGILFKFSDIEDYQTVYKKGFHKATGSRFYRKSAKQSAVHYIHRLLQRFSQFTKSCKSQLTLIAIPCRPQKTFMIYVFDIPDEIPEEDIRHSLYKFTSVVEVLRLYFAGTSPHGTGTCTPKQILEKTPPRALSSRSMDGEMSSNAVPKEANSVIRVTVASLEECNILLQSGLDFYGATYFPTELATPQPGAKLATHGRVMGGNLASSVRDMMPVFDQAGMEKYRPPSYKPLKSKNK